MVIGKLMYAMIGTRPDLAFVISSLGQHNAAPDPIHIAAAKRVLRYLQHTRNHGPRFTASTLSSSTHSSTHSSTPIGYCDSDWGSDISTRRSTTGYVFMLANAAITWKSRKQPTVALSSTEGTTTALSGLREREKRTGSCRH